MAFSRLLDDIETKEGVFDPDKKYYITNTTDEDIEITWAAGEPRAQGHGKYKIKVGEVGGPYPQFIAYHILRHLVNREMQKDGKTKLFGSASHRRPYEDRFLKEVVEEGGHPTGEDPLRAKIREEERMKLMADMVGINPTQAISEGTVTTSETRRKAIEREQQSRKEN